MMKVKTFFKWIETVLTNIIFALLTKYKTISKDVDKKLFGKFNVKGLKIIIKGCIEYFVSHKDH